MCENLHSYIKALDEAPCYHFLHQHHHLFKDFLEQAQMLYYKFSGGAEKFKSYQRQIFLQENFAEKRVQIKFAKVHLQTVEHVQKTSS